MVKYQCKKCGKEFIKKFNYEQHKNRKTSCHHGSKTTTVATYQCKYCEKFYSRKDSLKRHFSICKKKIKKNSYLVRAS